jgi:hypothetical protein
MMQSQPLAVLWDGRPVEHLSLTELRAAFIDVSVDYSELAGDPDHGKPGVIDLVSSGFCYAQFDSAARTRFRERTGTSRPPIDLGSPTDLGGSR